jgi:hypothetical protein
MTTVAEVKATLVVATNALVRRRRVTTNPDERKAIDDAIENINAQIGLLDQMQLLQAAAAVANAADALQAIVVTARLGPFDATIDQLAAAAKTLSDLRG